MKKTKIINKTQFVEMKKYNIDQMNTFCGILYHQAFHAGVDAANDADFRIKLFEVLENTKGVGPILTKRIMETAKDIS